MVGDSDSDVEAGQAAGCRTVLVEHPGSTHRRTGDVLPTLTAADLWDAAQRILAAD
jgi:phosphoglycolate phosphatase-like HAD superfamily hydrolase